MISCIDFFVHFVGIHQRTCNCEDLCDWLTSIEVWQSILIHAGCGRSAEEFGAWHVRHDGSQMWHILKKGAFWDSGITFWHKGKNALNFEDCCFSPLLVTNKLSFPSCLPSLPLAKWQRHKVGSGINRCLREGARQQLGMRNLQPKQPGTRPVKAWLLQPLLSAL